MLLLSGGATSPFHFSVFIIILFYLFIFYLFLFIGTRQQATHAAFPFIYLNLSYFLVHSCRVNTGTYDTFYKVFFYFQHEANYWYKKKKKRY